MTGAAAPATDPAVPPLLAAARGVLSGATESHYSHRTAIDERAGTYDCDCSGLIDYLLKRTSPSHYRLLPHAKGRRPLAVHFYAAFTAAATRETPGGAGAAPVWRHVLRLQDARPGDVLAWRRAELTPGEDTGHVVLIDSAPVPDGLDTFAVTVIDSTKSPHANDTRKPGQTGVGRGTLWLKVDGEGRPAGFRWKSNGTRFTSLPIAIGRCINVPRLDAPLAERTPSED
jgi:hypothetical protein